MYLVKFKRPGLREFLGPQNVAEKGKFPESFWEILVKYYSLARMYGMSSYLHHEEDCQSRELFSFFT